MSSHLGSGNATLVTGVPQLVEHHARGEKPREAWRIGTEHEKFAFSRGLEPLQYRGAPGVPGSIGIVNLLEGMQTCCGWQPLVDHGELIALESNEGAISLEPGGQVELSGQARSTIHETKVELDRHVSELERLTAELGVRWMWLGAHPVHQPSDLGFMPKRRYAVMREYLPTRGTLALHMMQATSTVQANLDYGSERDMGDKMRAAMGLSSIVTAMFANSPFQSGKPSGLKTFRAQVWGDTDNDRSGLLPFVFAGETPSYEQYVRWALDVPMFFIVRGGELLPTRGATFRDIWDRGFQGHQATMEDWELHLSTLFPDVRMKTYLETRTTDCVPPRFIPALPALWKGILYSDSAVAAAWDLTKRWSFSERQQHRQDVPKDALDTAIPGSRGKTVDLAREVMAIAQGALAEQAKAGGYADEAIYLEPLNELLRRGWCPADEVLAKWRPSMTPKDLIGALVEPAAAAAQSS